MKAEQTNEIAYEYIDEREEMESITTKRTTRSILDPANKDRPMWENPIWRECHICRTIQKCSKRKSGYACFRCDSKCPKCDVPNRELFIKEGVLACYACLTDKSQS